MTIARYDRAPQAGAFRDQDGDRIVRTIDLLDIDGATASNLLAQALNDPLTPQFQDPHPDYANLLVANVDVFPLRAKGVNCASARVIVEYKPRVRTTGFNTGQTPSSTGPALKQYTSNLNTIRVETDNGWSGAALPLVTRPRGETNAANNVLQPIEITTADPVLQFERLEDDEAAIEGRKETHEGTVNSLTIIGANVTHPARTLFLTNITARSVDGGTSWQVTYVIQKNRNTWDFTLTHKDESGVADKPIYDTNNRITYRVIPESDFTGLSLNW